MSEFPEFCAEIPSVNLVDSDLVRTISIKTQIKSTDSARHVALHFRVRSPSPQMISMPYAGLVCPNCRRSAKPGPASGQIKSPGQSLVRAASDWTPSFSEGILDVELRPHHGTPTRYSPAAAEATGIFSGSGPV